jgi:hypothetical protein
MFYLMSKPWSGHGEANIVQSKSDDVGRDEGVVLALAMHQAASGLRVELEVFLRRRQIPQSVVVPAR